MLWSTLLGATIESVRVEEEEGTQFLLSVRIDRPGEKLLTFQFTPVNQRELFLAHFTNEEPPPEDGAGTVRTIPVGRRVEAVSACIEAEQCGGKEVVGYQLLDLRLAGGGTLTLEAEYRQRFHFLTVSYS